MSTTMVTNGPLPRTAYHAAYRAQQASFRLPLVAAHRALRALTRRVRTPTEEAMRSMRRRYEDLIERDLRNVDEGAYPQALLFQMPLLDYARVIPRWLAEIPRAHRRATRGHYKDLPEDVDLEMYPPYFRRTFHWQSDGYLSKSSAELYDLGVEFLFMGCADVMRRQVIPPITRFLEDMDRPARILDVACGTGRTLSQLAIAHPTQRYFGVDLSPYYIEVARERLANVSGVSLVSENAETLPYRDDYFDVVTSVYLFHELPRNARRNVLHEIKRVLRPGGLLVIEDSEQLTEEDPIAYFLENFTREMHEPFYGDYLRDDLSALATECGFEVTKTEPCWVAKVVTARAPET